eukprot:TRINITY_DN1518_c0_g1_i1.p1 TRINITY_DN1518_c0_g1~~TRINITY_DN1518_c0_g1_i1.p1  ORF type:complete len:706 (+),score=111.76 TRINITY_DN1518_c0_g1_i1:32-2119(+)
MSKVWKKYNLQQISEHSKEEGIWIIYQDKLLDVSKFKELHPGGEEILLENAGKDVTMVFDDICHTDDAKKMMTEYQIGVVDRSQNIEQEPSGLSMHRHLQCPICYEFFEDVRVVECGHSICFKCLKNTVNSKNTCVACPICRYKTQKLPDQLAINYTLQSVVDSFKKEQKRISQSRAFCALCKPFGNDVQEYDSDSKVEEENLQYCPSCGFLCKKHVREHDIKNKSSEGHQLKPKRIDDLPFCDKHKEVCKLYCGSCSIVICQMCLVYEHVNHSSITTIPDASNQQRSKVSKFIQELSNLAPVLDEHIKNQKENILRYQESINELNKRINESNEKITEIQSVSEKIPKEVSKLVEFSHLNDADILKLGSIQSIISSIESRIPYLYNQYSIKSMNQIDSIDQMSVASPVTLNKRFSLLRDGDQIHKYRFTRKIGENHLVDPNCLATGEDGSIYVSEYKTKQILVFDSDGNMKRKIHKKTWSPASLSIDRNQNIVVSDENTHCLHICDASGNAKLTIGSSGKEDGKLSYPRQVVMDREGNYVVADRENCRIQMFSQDGKFIKKFGSRGTDNGMFQRPCGLSIDPDGNIVVVDADKRFSVQKFDPSGKFVEKLFINKEDFNPKIALYGLNIDSEGNYIICDTSSNQIILLDNQGKTVDIIGKTGTNDGEFSSLFCATVDCFGRIIALDRKSKCILIFS